MMICPKCKTEHEGRLVCECPECGIGTKRLKMDTMYLDIVHRISLMSHAVRRKVAAILVKDGNILGFGWNGMPSGEDNCCELPDGSTDPRVIHAEMNLFAKLLTSNGNTEGATMYLTLSPCYDCSKLIIQCKIKRVVFSEVYRVSEPIEFLKAAGVEVHYLVK